MPNRDIPHGHGLSHKKGLSDGLLDETRFADGLPNGHDASYRRGFEEGSTLRDTIARRIRPDPDA